jgi:hypothetical protein
MNIISEARTERKRIQGIGKKEGQKRQMKESKRKEQKQIKARGQN